MHRIAAISLWMCLCGVASAAVSPSFAITKDTICGVLAVPQAECAAGVRLVSQPVSREPGPQLRIVRQSAGTSPALVEIGCARSGCVPFYVQLTYGTGLTAASAPVAVPPIARIVPLVRRGEVVWMVQENAVLRIRQRVLCLLSGAAGQGIRVREMDKPQRTLEATVAGPGLVVAPN